jgi:NAD(P)-dependent dehydrogenase (short-subunit alcohol dehydrogenase family)
VADPAGSLADLLSFRGKEVLITGAASGMGNACAELVSASGGTVHAIDLQPASWPVGEGGGRAYQLDLRDEAAIDDLLREVPERVHVLLNCAGLPGTFPAADVLRVNYLGLRYLTEGVIERLSEGGAVVSVASRAGLIWRDHLDAILELMDMNTAETEAELARRPVAQAEAYKYSKACVIVYTMMRAAQLAGRGIRVNCSLAGPTDTPMMREHFHAGLTPEQRVKSVRFIGRQARPMEQAAAITFLASDAASYVSGVQLAVDGGAQGGYVTGVLEAPDIPHSQGQASFAPADEHGRAS